MGGLIFVGVVMATTDSNQDGAIDAAGLQMAKGLTAIGMSIWFALMGLIVYLFAKYRHRKK